MSILILLKWRSILTFLFFSTFAHFFSNFLVLKHLNPLTDRLMKLMPILVLILLNFNWPLRLINIFMSWNYWHLLSCFFYMTIFFIFWLILRNKALVGKWWFFGWLQLDFPQSFLNFTKSLHITIILLCLYSFIILFKQSRWILIICLLILRIFINLHLSERTFSWTVVSGLLKRSFVTWKLSDRTRMI